MFKDIYKQEYKLFFDCFPKAQEESNRPMGVEPISNKEKQFIEQYIVRLQEEQNKVNKDENIVYTKITMASAIKNKLCYLSLVFHPISISKRRYFECEETDETKKTFEDIIIWETTQDKTYLTNKELEVVIKLFRFLKD